MNILLFSKGRLGFLDKEIIILNWRRMVFVWVSVWEVLCFPTKHCPGAECAICFSLMTTFLYLELRKSIYRVWETVKLLQCKSFCLLEGKVDQEGLRNQRIKPNIIKYNYTIDFNHIYYLTYMCIKREISLMQSIYCKAWVELKSTWHLSVINFDYISWHWLPEYFK